MNRHSVDVDPSVPQVNFPLDTIKTRLQTDSLSNPKYRSSAHCVWKVTQQECTFFELYRGLSLCLARAIPGSAVQFFVFESCFRTFSEPGLFLAKIQNWPSMAELIQSAPERPIPRALQRINSTLIRKSLGT